MRFLYQNTLRLNLPLGWIAEEGEDCLLCSHPRGEGAITVSLHSAETGGETLESYLKILAERYRKKYVAKITRVLIAFRFRRRMLASSGEGITHDGWHTAFRFVSNGRQVAMFTYLCKTRTREWNKAVRILERAVFID